MGKLLRPQNGENHGMKATADLGIEGFHLPDNLMIVGAVQSGGYPVFLATDGKARTGPRGSMAAVYLSKLTLFKAPELVK
jgi:hypothetical protein